MMEVRCLSMTQYPLWVIYSAYRECYRSDSIMKDAPITILKAEQEALIRKGIAAGHLSPLEHVQITFAVDGISRACSHQLVRHRIASYSQRSQRYVDESETSEYVVPDSIANNDEANIFFSDIMEHSRLVYQAMIEAGIPKEDARYILPNATPTSIVVSMNCREMLNFFEQRCCARAQWEIRTLAEKMLSICKDALPVVFENAGAKCERLGYCTEIKGCGRYGKK